MIIYMPLEKYEERYTYQLQDWTEKAFKRKFIKFITIEGTPINDSESIQLGQVLDAFGRPYYSLTQIANLIKFLQTKNYSVPTHDIIFFEDLFSPGYEALPYIFEQLKYPPRIFTRCLAQTIDSDDFTFPWRNWMRPFEQLVNQTATGIFLANTAMGINMQIAQLDKADLYITGLSFDASEVMSRVLSVKPWKKRSNKVVYTSRFDVEKQPHFFLDVVEKIQSNFENSSIQFDLLVGSEALKSTDPSAVKRAEDLHEKGLLTIKLGLSKNEYYKEISKAKVLFNCSLQDWQSNTLNDASAFNVAPLFPAYKSFPEALFNNHKHLYVPWSINDATEKLLAIINNENENDVYELTNKIAAHQTKTIDRIIDIFQGKGSQYLYTPFNHRYT